MIQTTQSLISHLACAKCGTKYSHDQLQTYATCCNQPLVTHYTKGQMPNPDDLAKRENSMWRYAEMLPLLDQNNRVSLGEGMTPIIPLKRLAREHHLENLYLKDEGLNPTGSFKARGLSMAISKAKELGVTECIIPTAGNAGGALSAYCAVAGMKATIVMPRKTPLIFQQECQFYGAKLILVDGLIDECGKLANQITHDTGAFNVSTLKEPYRLEGKKTMGYEIAEQMKWQLPDIILYPTGGGTGLLGIWKAFQEMRALGWLTDQPLPKMIAVQTANCSPIVDLINGTASSPGSYTMSIANGLSVPVAFGQDMIMQVLQASKGGAVKVIEEEIKQGVHEISAKEGILISPEGAAIWQALKRLVQDEKIQPHQQILLLNTGSGYKYLENLN
ncbi:threonine synthase [marine bacterium AO1-C]|nr:threonine synthase [marine bacterium AO1-C]